MTTAEYLHQFLPTGFQLRLGEHMTIPAFAELLFGFMMDVEKERFAEEGIAEEPDACRVRDYTDRLAWRIGSREYERWEDAEEELRLRAEDDLCHEACMDTEKRAVYCTPGDLQKAVDAIAKTEANCVRREEK